MGEVHFRSIQPPLKKVSVYATESIGITKRFLCEMSYFVFIPSTYFTRKLDIVRNYCCLRNETTTKRVTRFVQTVVPKTTGERRRNNK